MTNNLVFVCYVHEKATVVEHHYTIIVLLILCQHLSELEYCLT